MSSTTSTVSCATGSTWSKPLAILNTHTKGTQRKEKQLLLGHAALDALDACHCQTGSSSRALGVYSTLWRHPQPHAGLPEPSALKPSCPRNGFPSQTCYWYLKVTVRPGLVVELAAECHAAVDLSHRLYRSRIRGIRRRVAMISHNSIT